MAAKARSTAVLLTLFVALPSACIAMYKWGHLLLKPAPPKPLVVYSATKPAWKSSVDEAPPRSSVDLIPREDAPGGVPGAPPVPRRPRVPTAAELVAEQEAKPGGFGQPGRPGAGLAYPKLRSTRGWRSWFGADGAATQHSEAFYAIPQDQGAAAASQEAQSAAQAPAPAPAAAKPEPLAPPQPKKGYKPPQVFYNAAKSGATTAAGSSVGQAEVHAGDLPERRRAPPTRPETFIGPPDRIPDPNPEKALKEGKCPKPGWWFNAYNGLCYHTQPGCQGADYAKAGCKKS